VCVCMPGVLSSATIAKELGFGQGDRSEQPPRGILYALMKNARI
jgi:hypothetical protein